MVKVTTVIAISLVILLFAGVLGVAVTSLPGPGPDLGPTDITFPDISPKGKFDIGDISGHDQLDDTEYATGWKPESGTVRSEKISITSATVTYDQSDIHVGVFTNWGLIIKSYRYDWYVEGDIIKTGIEHPNNELIVLSGDVWTKSDGGLTGYGFADNEWTFAVGSFTNTDQTVFGLSMYPDEISYTLLGTQIGELRVELIVSFEAATRDLGTLRNQEYVERLGYFTALLKSGQGYVRIGDSLPDLIEEGSDVTFYLQTGFTHGRGWTVYFVRSSGEKHEFKEDGFNGQDGFGSLVDFTIPVGWFIPGGDNEIEIELYNHLWQESMSTFFVIDDIDLAPGKPTITWQTDYKAGSDVSVGVSSIPNNVTNSPISYFRVYAYYGEPGSMPGSDFPSEFLIFKTDYSAQNNQADFSFTLIENQGGQVSMKINAIDQEGRASLGEFKSMNTVLPDEEGGGDDDDDVDYPFTLTLAGINVLIIAAIIISILLLIKPIRDVLIPFKTKYWYVWDSILIIAIIIIGYAVYWLGINPGWTL